MRDPITHPDQARSILRGLPQGVMQQQHGEPVAINIGTIPDNDCVLLAEQAMQDEATTPTR